MKSEEYVLSKFTGEISERISKKTISRLQKVRDTLSGDDSGLINAWDEICVQLQDEKSGDWDSYDETMRSFVEEYIEELQPHEESALWFQTEGGYEWLCNNEEYKEKDIPIYVEDVVQYIVQEYIYDKARTWGNKRIRKYLGILP